MNKPILLKRFTTKAKPNNGIEIPVFLAISDDSDEVSHFSFFNSLLPYIKLKSVKNILL